MRKNYFICYALFTLSAFCILGCSVEVNPPTPSTPPTTQDLNSPAKPKIAEPKINGEQEYQSVTITSSDSSKDYVNGVTILCEVGPRKTSLPAANEITEYKEDIVIFERPDMPDPMPGNRPVEVRIRFEQRKFKIKDPNLYIYVVAKQGDSYSEVLEQQLTVNRGSVEIEWNGHQTGKYPASTYILYDNKLGSDLPTPEKETLANDDKNLYLAGWYSNKELTTPLTSIKAFEQDLVDIPTIYAKWLPLSKE